MAMKKERKDDDEVHTVTSKMRKKSSQVAS